MLLKKEQAKKVHRFTIDRQIRGRGTFRDGNDIKRVEASLSFA